MVTTATVFHSTHFIQLCTRPCDLKGRRKRTENEGISNLSNHYPTACSILEVLFSGGYFVCGEMPYPYRPVCICAFSSSLLTQGTSFINQYELSEQVFHTSRYINNLHMENNSMKMQTQVFYHSSVQQKLKELKVSEINPSQLSTFTCHFFPS